MKRSVKSTSPEGIMFENELNRRLHGPILIFGKLIDCLHIWVVFMIRRPHEVLRCFFKIVDTEKRHGKGGWRHRLKTNPNEPLSEIFRGPVKVCLTLLLVFLPCDFKNPSTALQKLQNGSTRRRLANPRVCIKPPSEYALLLPEKIVRCLVRAPLARFKRIERSAVTMSLCYGVLTRSRGLP